MENLKHYLSLATLLAIGFAAFWVFNYNRLAQVGVTIALGAAYVLWGLVHHRIKKDFHFQVMIEYIAVAVVACTLVVFMLLRA